MRLAVVVTCFAFACGPSAEDPCKDMGCPAPAAPVCSGTMLTTTLPATCTAAGSHTDCHYDTMTTDCAAAGMVCSMGACVATTDPCATANCNTPPAASCDANNVATSYDQAGTCDGSTGAAVCSYPSHTTDCAALGQVCQSGACFDACAGATCNTPPDATCNQNTLTSYDAAGSCDGSTGAPVCSYASQQTDCTQTDEICAGGACADPCSPNPCTMPPPDSCNGSVLAQHPATGTCTSPGGVVQCDYTPTQVDCGAQNRACEVDACVDPCIGFTCNTPPGPSCGGTVQQTFAPTGTCVSPGGVPSCTYAETDHDCALGGQTCGGGACTGTFEFCRIQFPDSITDVPGTTQTVFSRIFVQGITDQSGVNDPSPSVVVQLGLGTGSDPTTYTYAAAAPNPGYGPGSPGYEPNNDEYLASFTVPSAPGTAESYAYRLSDDGGTTWIYCDTGNAGSSDGFTTPGVLEIAAPYFSQYIEGSANASNKAVSIYNPGSVPFAVGGCLVKVFANGGTASINTTITAGASIAAGGVYTLCKTGITDATHCDQSTGSGLWNGNDAIELMCGTTVYDVIGQIGFDPGAAGWGSGMTTTTDHTLLRVCTVFAGDTNGGDAFDPTIEWAGYPADTLTYLGARDCPLP